MLYSDMSKPLLNGLAVRRSSWAPGCSVVLMSRKDYARPPTGGVDQLLGALNLALLTPGLPHRYFTHSVDRRATDWEILHGTPELAAG